MGRSATIGGAVPRHRYDSRHAVCAWRFRPPLTSQLDMDGAGLPSLRLAALYEFMLSQLPSAPARVLEVGCGRGEIALALARAGYSLTAIDPEAPDGAIFRRTRLEDFVADGDFDAVVASVSLHHVEDIDATVAKIEALLRPRGLLILEEFAKERLTGTTARWYYHQRRAQAAVRDDEAPLPDDFEAWLSQTDEQLADIHTFSELRRALDARFTEQFFDWVPYLFDYRLEDALEPLERDLIETGAIDATGCRYVGQRRR
jgi:ubiquinone/menaquinone biosynthesis C-methylase UbiE